MAKMTSVLAIFAAGGLLLASPAVAQTRAADSLPSSSVTLDTGSVSRTASPIVDANELRRGSPFLILLLLASIGGLILIFSGGGNDSPG